MSAMPQLMIDYQWFIFCIFEKSPFSPLNNGSSHSEANILIIYSVGLVRVPSGGI